MIHTIKKEVRMKKFVVFALALFLVLPAISYAGSATSRYDVTITGYVGIDFGWVDQLQGGDAAVGLRDNAYGTTWRHNKSNFFSSAGNTQLGFLVKGPDGWGAKTSAYIEGDFRGITGTPRANQGIGPAGATGYSGAGVNTTGGTFSLRHAFMKFDWPGTSLTIGQTWQLFSLMPYSYGGVMLTYWGIAADMKGTRQPTIRIRQELPAGFSTTIGIISPYETIGAATNSTGVDAFSASNTPWTEFELAYNTKALGTIGPFGAQIAFDAMLGKARYIYTNPGNTGYSSQTTQAWGAAVKGYVPIIAAKGQSKANTLAMSGNLFTGQNMGWYMGPLFHGSWDRDQATTLQDYGTPVVTGGFASLSYYITDKVFVTGWWGQMRYAYSEAYRSAAWANAYGALHANNFQYMGYQILNLSYDVNPAIRLGAEVARIKTAWAGFVTAAGGMPAAGGTNVGGRQGHVDHFRVGAWYFF